VCTPAGGSPLKVRLRLTDQVTSQLIVDAQAKDGERSAISRHAEPAAQTGMPAAATKNLPRHMSRLKPCAPQPWRRRPAPTTKG
jgi:hypothetical protein